VTTVTSVPLPRSGIADLLRTVALFDSAEASTLAGLAAGARTKVLPRGGVLFVAGERATSVHAVVDGVLRVFSTSIDGDEVTHALLTAGALVGELGVIQARPHSASVAAVRRTQLVEIPAAVMRSAYDADPAIARRLVSLLADRVRAQSDVLTDLASLDLTARLAKFLLGESERQGAAEFALVLNQTELGQVVGGSRQSVNQALRTLESSGMISASARRVRILDAQRLRMRSMSSG
jgi:CRP/FNR family cyclic AMP-dependent transcriptional regulator